MKSPRPKMTVTLSSRGHEVPRPALRDTAINKKMLIPIALTAPFIIILLLLALRRNRRQLPLPPGPRPLPIIGNLYQIPDINPWRTFKQWHQTHGPIISVKTGSNITIILGSHKAARDLLEKRSSIYSSRPHLVLIGDFIYGGYQTALLPYGAQWRLHRRIQAAFVNVRTSQRYRILQDIESKQLLREMLHSRDFAKNLRRYSASVLFALTYGKRMLSYEQAEIREISEIMKVVLEEASRSSVAEAFPILNALPNVLAPWKHRAKLLFERHVHLFAKYMNAALETKSWNCCKEALKMDASGQVDRLELSFILGSLYEASHTSAVVLEVFVLASVLHPDAVVPAQEELDRVVGPNRLPTFDDMARLPYVDAFIREVMRWRPATPGGMPHVNVEEDSYMGYRIPKGATVVANHWSLDFDETVFKDPYEFKPQRWLEDPSLPLITFGFGRRVCPGKHIGRNSLFIVMSRFLWAYRIGYAYDDGKKQEIDPWDMTQTSDSGPMPFKASFQPRSLKHREVINEEFRVSEKDADVLLRQVGSDLF